MRERLRDHLCAVKDDDP
jgi:hypothetical protein